MIANVSLLGSKAKRDALVERTLWWWDRHRRSLPWRAPQGQVSEPYRVWLSEILLQQTTASAAAPFYLRFVARWPTVEDLAEARSEEVIAAFAGLGYYARARNLHACAKEIALRGGRFPADESDLLSLPGVGPYTAAAISAIAFGRRAAPVDGNIARILARLVALEEPVKQAKSAVASVARALAPDDRAGDFAQALMDIGATICRPRGPDCKTCPLKEDCLAFCSGAPEVYPRRAEAKAKPARYGAVFFARRADGAFLARRRPPQGLLPSTVELPGTSWTAVRPGRSWTVDAPVVALWRELPGAVRQAFSHFSLSLTVYGAAFEAHAPGGLFWVRLEAIDALGFSSVMRKAIDHALSAANVGKVAASDNLPPQGYRSAL
ncbi:MAG TPA: A/G-specific adenine glycosylase [Roseiarcus sp.]|nr:A/G-specific adenine glycosylase [Roseiarcus sp.]